MVSADPIRMFLYRWMIETGDPVELMAKGFDVDATTICELLPGERSPDHQTRSDPAEESAELGSR